MTKDASGHSRTRIDVPREGQQSDCKSLRRVTGRSANFAELAQDCVCFANGSGGQLLIGIEDGASGPPAGQRIDPELLDRIRKRVGELTVNVQILPEMRRTETGDEYIALTIPRSVGVASTSDGRYFVRVGDTCRPVVGDDVLRLADERPAVPWESMEALRVARSQLDRQKWSTFAAAIRASDRVKSSVKEKTDDELLDHYGLATGDVLTNLGVLLFGTTVDRGRLGTAPVIQAIKYDERGDKVAKPSGMTTRSRRSSWLTPSGRRSRISATATSFPRACFGPPSRHTRRRSSAS